VIPFQQTELPHDKIQIRIRSKYHKKEPENRLNIQNMDIVTWIDDNTTFNTGVHDIGSPHCKVIRKYLCNDPCIIPHITLSNIYKKVRIYR